MMYIFSKKIWKCKTITTAKSGGGVAKAGTKFELLKEPRPEKKMYKLRPIGVKFPYNLSIRPNVFKRYFEKLDDTIS